MSIVAPFADLAKDSSLAPLATEVTLAEVSTKLDDLASIDAGLTPLATEVSLQALITAIAAMATEATLASVIKAEDTTAVSGDAGIPLLALRYVSDTVTTSNDGDYTNIKVDEEGRLKVASKPASYPDATGDITAIQATIGTPVAGGTVIADVTRASNVMMFCTGTFAGINVSFEGSLEATGENWFGVQAIRSNANTVETATGALSAAPAYAWELSVNALARVRVRCTARTSGTQSWRIKLGTYATEPIPGSQVTGTQPVSGSVTVSGTATNTPATPTPIAINSAATTNASVVKASAGTLFGLTLWNNGAAAAFVKLFNKATAPVPGTDTPVMVIPIGAGAMVQLNFSDLGHRFATGIGIAITNLQADLDATAIAAGQVKVVGSYI